MTKTSFPLSWKGATVYFETTYPTMDEIETHPHIVLTDGEVPWDPMGVDMNADRPSKGNQDCNEAIHRRYRVDHLNLHSNDLAGKWQMDWMPSKAKFLSQNVGAFVISNDSFTEVYPQPDHKSISAADSLQRFCDDVGVPVNLKTDRAKEFVERMTDFMMLVKKRHINMTYAEPERKNQITRVDREIRDLKRRWHDKMRKKNVHERLWDYGLTYTGKIMQILPRSQLRDRTSMEAVTGKTPDISEFCDFDFHDLVCWYHAGVHRGVGQQNRELGRWLGVSEHVGSDMCYCYWILEW
ncbi:hypothetical protein ACHAWF_005759 [Thalassiosira exigua]